MRAIPNMLFIIFAPEQSHQLDYATCDYKEGVTVFLAKLLLSVRSWRKKLRRCARALPMSRLSVKKEVEVGFVAVVFASASYGTWVVGAKATTISVF